MYFLQQTQTIFSYFNEQSFFLSSYIKQLTFFLYPPVALFYWNCPCWKKKKNKVPSLFLKPIRNVIHITQWKWIELFPTATQKIHNHHNYWWHLINIQLPLYSSYSWTIHLFQPKTNALLIIFHLTEQPTCAHFHQRLRLAQREGRAWWAQPGTALLTTARCKPAPTNYTVPGSVSLLNQDAQKK